MNIACFCSNPLLFSITYYKISCNKERKGKNGAVYAQNYAVCLETQRYPDAPNKPDFPSTVLKAGEVFSSRTVYAFSVE